MPTIEQEIWEEFDGLSDLSLIDPLSYGEANSHLGGTFEDRLSSVRSIGEFKLTNDTYDYKIDKLLAASPSGENIDWGQMVKLYPRNQNVEYIGSVVPLNDWRKIKVRLYSAFDQEDEAVEYLIDKKWGEEITCPHCGYHKVYDMVMKTATGRSIRGFKCRNNNCYKKFSPKSDTLFNSSKLALKKWFGGIYLLSHDKTKKISTYQLSDELKVTQDTAWYMTKRLRERIHDPLIRAINKSIITI